MLEEFCIKRTAQEIAMFGIHGIGGFVVLVLVLVSIWIGLGTLALTTQQETANQPYSEKDHYEYIHDAPN